MCRGSSEVSDGSKALLEVTRFLREHPPFDALDPDRVARLGSAAEVEFHRAGETILAQAAGPVHHMWIVRSGAVEIIHDGRVLDMLGPGELFGQASMLSGLPVGFEARATEDTLCYRVGAEIARELLSAPAAVRFLARSLIERGDFQGAARERQADPASHPVSTMVRGEALICPPATSVRDAAQMMSARSKTSIVVDIGDGTLGIVTDSDLRRRVLAQGLGGDTPVSVVMSAPAYTCTPDQLGGDVLLDMLHRGFRHLPVVSVTGEILGVVKDQDIAVMDTRSSTFLRKRIARAQSVEELVAAAAELRPSIVSMHDAGVAALKIQAIHSIVVDALTRRLVELGGPAAHEPFAWLALGSHARRELAPSSDLDSAIVWFGDAPEAEIRPRLHRLGQDVVAALARCGLRSDEHGASASDMLFVRSLESWQRVARSWIENPTQEQALMLVSVMIDSRPVWGVHRGTPVTDTLRRAPRNPALLRLVARFALAHRPPTGFLRGLVVEHTGEHRGTLDLKNGGVSPIVNLARWAGMTAGVTSAATIERLRAGNASGTLSEEDLHTLEDAFELVSSLRVAHQVEQIRAGEEPDDHIDPATLSSLMRSQLKEAFRAVASIQKQVTAELNLGVR